MSKSYKRVGITKVKNDLEFGAPAMRKLVVEINFVPESNTVEGTLNACNEIVKDLHALFEKHNSNFKGVERPGIVMGDER